MRIRPPGGGATFFPGNPASQSDKICKNQNGFQKKSKWFSEKIWYKNQNGFQKKSGTKIKIGIIQNSE